MPPFALAAGLSQGANVLREAGNLLANGLTPAAVRADGDGMKRTMSTKAALVGFAASLAGFAVASVAYFGPRR